MLESRITDKLFSQQRIAVWEREHLELEAKFAAEMVGRWGTVAGVPDGEDSAGRSKIRLMTPQELVERACETAELLMTEFRSRNWAHLAPSLEEADRRKKEESQ